MCGICGFIGPSGEPAENRKLLQRMNLSLAHRGPDASGTWVSRHVSFGMTRLSIIDLSPSGDQPMLTEDQQTVVVFNGEIYNYRFIRSNLQEKKYVFRTKTDTECLLHLYNEYGDKMLEHLRGMFAFALWDNKRHRLLLARDRLGKKPLYYFSGNGYLAFSSEIKSLLEFPYVSRELDWEGVNSFFTYRYVIGPRTIFRDIKKLLPGHYIVIEREKPYLHQSYWKVPRVDPDRDPLHVDELDELLQLSVKLRLISDVPVGAFLSGGLDSSLIVALMSKFHSGPIKTFSIGFDVKGDFNEAPFAEKVSRHFGTEHTSHTITVDDIIEELPNAVYHLDEPIADSAAVPTLMLSRIAAKQVKVVLTGEGADELFAGYSRYYYELLIGKLQKSAFFPLIQKTAFAGMRLPINARYRKALQLLQQPPLTRMTSYNEVFRYSERTELFSSLKALQSSIEEYEDPTQFPSTLDWLLCQELQTWLPDDLLMKVDKMTMAASLEARAPFLDHVLVETMARIPAKHKLNLKEDKIPLRQVARKYLPAEISGRKKHGFNLPLDYWFRNELKGFGEDVLMSNGSDPYSPNQKMIQSYWNEHQSGRRNFGQKLWSLLCWKLWRLSYLPQD